MTKGGTLGRTGTRTVNDNAELTMTIAATRPLVSSSMCAFAIELAGNGGFVKS